MKLSRDSLREAFHDLVLPDNFLDQLGPGADRPAVAVPVWRHRQRQNQHRRADPARFTRIVVLVPYAVEVNGHIMTVFDPVVHRAVADDDEMLDPRWVVCERPCITVGGELSAAMLELRLDEATRVFISPCQMKANNGIFIIDDFGRQVLSPRELLNRWIVPLDRRVDYLTLASGHEVPGAVRADGGVLDQPESRTNWPTKRFCAASRPRCMVENVSNEVFDEIFRRVVQRNRFRPSPAAPSTCASAAGPPPATCCTPAIPIDIFRLVKAISEYEGRPVRMTRASHRPRRRAVLRQKLAESYTLDT